MMNGRPLKEIDWSKVEKSLMAGCSGMQIAANLGIHEDTLYSACEREKEMAFSAFSAIFRQKGDLLLHEAQFNVAIGDETRDIAPDKSMLIWLGKNRLEQSDKQDIKQTATVTNAKPMDEIDLSGVSSEELQKYIEAKELADSIEEKCRIKKDS